MYDDLIEMLRCCGLTNGSSLGRHMGLMDEAADAIAALQAQKAELKQRFDEVNDFEKSQCAKLLAKLSHVEAERDALRCYYNDMTSKPDCNTCARKVCSYRPKLGETVRANCPLWRGAQGVERGMERLTFKDRRDIWCVEGTNGVVSVHGGDGYVSGEPIDRLAAYEDTGLEPEEIPRELARAYETMLLLKRYQALGTVEELTALVKARDEGRVLPEKSMWTATCHGSKLVLIMDVKAAQEADAALGGGGDG